MIPRAVTESVLELPEQERLALAHLLVESIPANGNQMADAATLREAIQRIEDVVAGRVRGLSEEEFRRALV